MIEFKYKDKLFYTTNLHKKLKRLKITENDITIIREFEEQKQPETNKTNELPGSEDSRQFCYTVNNKIRSGSHKRSPA